MKTLIEQIQDLCIEHGETAVIEAMRDASIRRSVKADMQYALDNIARIDGWDEEQTQGSFNRTV